MSILNWLILLVGIGFFLSKGLLNTLVGLALILTAVYFAFKSRAEDKL